MKKRIFLSVVLIMVLSLLSAKDAYCGKGGHYAPGVGAVRDFIMPPKSGFYYAQYNPYYYTGAYYGSNGKKVKTLSAERTFYVNNTPVHVTGEANIDLQIQSVGTSPLFFYVFEKNVLGAKYGVMTGAYFGYVRTKIKADVTVAVGGIEVSGLEIKRSLEIEDSDSGFGDFTISPLWLDWSGQHYDAWVMYGFYAPVGKYKNGKLVNIGRGFWSHEIALGAAYYPKKERQTAFVANIGYELNQKQRGSDTTPGENIAFEYGVSHYFTPRFELGLSGYSMFQVTRDHGGKILGNAPKSYVHAMGAECNYMIIKDKFGVTGKFLYEYAARDRTKGELATINFYYIF
ncbi:MAG: transporter [Candidatus Omnitrophica bacterium]|nr:transporter [Candidatus Omnitrophota bacterium]